MVINLPIAASRLGRGPITAVIITIGPSNLSVFMVCLVLSVNLKATNSCRA